VKHRTVAVLISRETGGGAAVGDFDRRWQVPITNEAIVHLLGELRRFAMLVSLHDPVIFPVGNCVQQSNFHLRDELFLHLLIDRNGPMIFLLKK